MSQALGVRSSVKLDILGIVCTFLKNNNDENQGENLHIIGCPERLITPIVNSWSKLEGCLNF